MSRIADLPRRDWRSKAKPFVEALSAALRIDSGARLRLVQAASLLEVAELRGMFLNGRVGVGKTLAVALAPVMLAEVMPEVRALVLCPGGMKVETNAHFSALRKEWRLPALLELRSYSQISNMPRQETSLGDLFGGRGPNVIICDEADKLRNVTKSAVARQINDWMVAHGDTVFIGVTGTCDVQGLLDYAHLMDWALRKGSPLPRHADELREWSEVIDKGFMAGSGAVCHALGIPLDSSLPGIRAAYRQRLSDTPGVIIEDTPFDDVPLTIAEHVLDPECDSHFRRLRELWLRPDGVDLTPGSEDPDGSEGEDDRIQGSTIWPVARRMARGLCYVWDPLPPEYWLAARRNYFSWVRSRIEDHKFYTELQARRYAIDLGLPDWDAWVAVRDTFTPQQRTLWLSDAALRFCERWGAEGPGVIWTDDTAFAVKLAERTGWTYYGGKGLSRSGKLITDAPGDQVAIASRKANSTGRNLQYQWCRCLFTAPPNTSRDFEQAVGRFHREGQTRPVHADLLLACSEDFASIQHMLQGAKRTAESLYSQKAASVGWEHLKKPADAFGAFAT